MNNRSRTKSAETLFSCKKYQKMLAKPPTTIIKKCKDELSPEFDIITYQPKKTTVCKDEKVIDDSAIEKARSECEYEKTWRRRI